MLIGEKPPFGVLSPDLDAYSLRPRLCVAKLASGRNSDASPPGIEGVVCPLDLGILTHISVAQFPRMRRLEVAEESLGPNAM